MNKIIFIIFLISAPSVYSNQKKNKPETWESEAIDITEEYCKKNDCTKPNKNESKTQNIGNWKDEYLLNLTWSKKFIGNLLNVESAFRNETLPTDFFFIRALSEKNHAETFLCLLPSGKKPKLNAKLKITGLREDDLFSKSTGYKSMYCEI
jgi:hypothetical protein